MKKKNIIYKKGGSFSKITKKDFKEAIERIDEPERLLADGRETKSVLIIAVCTDDPEPDFLFVKNFSKIFAYSDDEHFLLSASDKVLLKVIDKQGNKVYLDIDNEPTEIYIGKYDLDAARCYYLEYLEEYYGVKENDEEYDEYDEEYDEYYEPEVKYEELVELAESFAHNIELIVSKLDETPEILRICVTM